MGGYGTSEFFVLLSHFAGSIAGLPRYTRMPRACTFVTIVGHLYFSGMFVYHLPVSELVVTAEEASAPTDEFPRCLTGHE